MGGLGRMVENRRLLGASRAAVWLKVFALALSMAVFRVNAGEEGPGLGVFYGYEAVPDGELSTLRGGFVTSSGIEVEVGIERMVFVNDVLQSKFVIDLTQLDRKALRGDLRPVVENYAGLLQSGGGNAVSEDVQGLVSSGVLQLIQNSLDGNKIGNLTGLNVDVKNYQNILKPDLGRMMDFEVTRSLDSMR